MKKLRVFVIWSIFQHADADELSPEKRETLLPYEHGLRILAPFLHAAPSKIDEFNFGVLCITDRSMQRIERKDTILIPSVLNLWLNCHQSVTYWGAGIDVRLKCWLNNLACKWLLRFGANGLVLPFHLCSCPHCHQVVAIHYETCS